MVETGDVSALEERAGKRLKTPKDVLEGAIALLGWLVKRGSLEVRVGVMRRRRIVRKFDRDRRGQRRDRLQRQRQRMHRG